MADKVYTDNGYTYTVSDNGTVTAKGTVSEDPASRKGMSSITPDGYDSKTDDKGHLIAAREGGVAADYNVSAQDRGLNRGAYKTAENAEVRLANKGYTVETEKTAYVSNPGEKPSAYMVNDTITTPDGKTHDVNLSFTNMSKSDMEEINQSVENMDIDDPAAVTQLPEDITPEDYDQIMTEYESSVKDEFDLENTTSVHFDNDAEDFQGESPSLDEAGSTGILDNNAEDFHGESPSLDESSSTGILDNNTEDFNGEAPSLDTTESAGIIDNDANDFQGEAPALDDSSSVAASYGDDMSDSTEGSDNGEGTDGGSDDGEGLD